MRADRRELAAIFAGGFIGAVARAELGAVLPATRWPWATFAVNVFGAALLGYAVTRLQERLPLSAYRRPFIGTGVCGGLTTFSTLQLELIGLPLGLAVAYAASSVAAGLLALAAATNLVRRV